MKLKESESPRDPWNQLISSQKTPGSAADWSQPSFPLFSKAPNISPPLWTHGGNLSPKLVDFSRLLSTVWRSYDIKAGHTDIVNFLLAVKLELTPDRAL